MCHDDDDVGNPLGLHRSQSFLSLPRMMAAQSLTSRPSETFMSGPDRREKLRREQGKSVKYKVTQAISVVRLAVYTSPTCSFSAVKEFYQRNECVYVGETAFNLAWATINPWINFQSLMGHLMRNGLVNSASDMEDISSPYLPAAMRHTNLKKLLKANGGNCGHFIFYMSLCDSLESNPLGHGDAVDEMKRCGECSGKTCIIFGIKSNSTSAKPS